jgi:hypothetical protein
LAVGLQEEIYADTALYRDTVTDCDFPSPNQTRSIMSDGDGGDSSFMNRASKNWTRSVDGNYYEIAIARENQRQTFGYHSIQLRVVDYPRSALL